jgi:prepilin-type N-terminal cleavage/methylation domain-containing protein
MSRGVTLIELLLVLVLIGTLTAMGGPRLAGTLDRLAADRAAREIAAAHLRARLTAITEGQHSLLTITADSLVIRLSESSDSAPRWWSRGAAADGVTLVGPSRPITFAPTGVTIGVANATYTLRRGAASRRVVISRWGRVRLE